MPKEAIEEFRKTICQRAKAKSAETILVPLPLAIKVVQAFDEEEKRAIKTYCCFTGVGQACPIHEK